ncbi:MAG: TIM barrel protein [Bacteroidota bacterium]
MNRRQFLETTATASAMALAPLSAPSLVLPQSLGPRMGISIASYAIRWRSKAASKQYPAFTDALQVLAHSQQLGAGGIQIGVRGWAEAFAGKVRDAREKHNLYLEGQISLPKDDGDDLARFEHEVKNAREAGATILRAVCLGGRRYETFSTLASFQSFKADSIAALERAVPVMQRNRVKLAIENHKDWRIQEIIAIIEHLGSPWMGITLDTGNNISLLEDPMEVVEALAPYTFTTHFKDMGVAPYQDGFLLAEVPLGNGMLDLSRVVQLCRHHNPDVTFNLEMITRDPLKIPCMTDAYWETFDNVNGRELARALRMVESAAGKTLPGISDKNPEEQLAFEEQNVRSSFAYASTHLGLG